VEVVKFQDRERSKGSGNGVGTILSAVDEAVGTVGILEAAGVLLVGRSLDDVKWLGREDGNGNVDEDSAREGI
jgi:hypothetical protein